MMAPLPVLGAIDVGTNAVRLMIARVLPDGSLERLHEERDPIRPGEGLFRLGSMPRPVADRLLVTLRRYAALGRRHGAHMRAVATSAVREAKNRDEIVRRVREEAGLLLEVVSGMEEARLTCLGVLSGRPPSSRSLLIDIGGGSTEIASAAGERPVGLWSIALGSVRLAELFDATGEIRPATLVLLREFAAEAIEKALPRPIPGAPRVAIGSSGTMRAVVGHAHAVAPGRRLDQKLLGRLIDRLMGLGAAGRRREFDPGRADIIVAGAVILEALVAHLGLRDVTAVDRGLRAGVLLDLQRRQDRPRDHSIAEAALALGNRFRFDESHARQVARLALALFDGLAPIHKLAAAVRPYLEVAAVLHDVGHAVSYPRHHKHTYYLVQNADIPGLADREREIVARIARFHRRSAPEFGHALMADLAPGEARTVRKLATMLRLADALDRSHHQPVRSLKVHADSRRAAVDLGVRGPADLELWDAAHEAELFRQVFGRRLEIRVHAHRGRS